MNVQRYELEIYHCNGGEVLVSETGDYVSHDDYAALEAKCAALAAENESIKFYLRNGPLIRKGGELAAAHQFAPETPATDAFLAEVRAQGVEMFAREMHADISEADAIEFAAKLRKGASA